MNQEPSAIESDKLIHQRKARRALRAQLWRERVLAAAPQLTEADWQALEERFA